MLQIKANRQFLELSSDIQIEFKFTNPVFGNSVFQEAYSYSFTIPYTSKNRGILKNGGSFFIQIVFDGFLLTQGTASVKLLNSVYSLEFKENQIDYKQTSEVLKLKELAFETIKIWEPLDAPITKVNKWNSHMVQNSIIDSPEEGTHKFPPILCFDRSKKENIDFTDYGSTLINRWGQTTFVKNIPTSVDNVWNTTVSPCPRIAYLLEKSVEALGLTIVENELNQIKEYLQLVHYSLLSFDGIEAVGNQFINVHLGEFNLSKVVPDLFVSDLFLLLDELFGIYVVVKNQTILIKLKSNLLNSESVDYSKYVNKSTISTNQTENDVVLSYDLEVELAGRFDSKVWYKQITRFNNQLPPPGVENVFITNFNKKTIGNKFTTKQNEVVLSYIPLDSFENYVTSVYANNDYQDNPSDVHIAMTILLRNPIDNPISSVFNAQDFTNGGKEKWSVGLVRGYFPVFNFSLNSYQNKLICSNQLSVSESLYDEELPNKELGTCSLYINNKQSHIDVYKKSFLNLIKSNEKEKRTLWLPIAKIMEIITWKNSKHLIRQRDQSFIGVVEELNFTIGINSVSETEISYFVQRAEMNNSSFNNDFNNDFGQ